MIVNDSSEAKLILKFLMIWSIKVKKSYSETVF
jgi:hypothetical protein